MTTNTQAADLVRLSVAAKGRSTDLVLPSRLPLAEILPEVASLVGVLDAYDVYGGYSLVGTDGRALDLDASFLAQGIHDGAVLTLVTGAEARDTKVYDDVVEAVADSVEELGSGWNDENARATSLAVSFLLLVVGAAVLLLQRGNGVAVTVVATVACVLLLVGGAVFARVRRDTAAATTVLVGSGPYAVAAGSTAATGDVFELPVVDAGLALAAVGVVSMLLLARRSWAFIPFVVLGLLAAAVGVIHLLTDLDAPDVVAIVTVAAVVLGSVIPWFALSTSRTMTAPMQSESDILAEPAPIDPASVRSGVRNAHDLVLGLALSVGVTVAVSAPLVVGLGWAGLGIVWAAGLVQMMRTRQYLLAGEVLVGLVGGAGAITSGTVWALVTQPGWAPVVGSVVGVAAVAVLVGLALPSRTTVRRGRLRDLVEGLALFVLVPLLVLALRLVAAIRG